EVSDVANAVIDHTDATMLSGETSVGKYPVDAVRIMGEVIEKAEESSFDDFEYENFSYKEDTMRNMSVLLCSLAKNIYEHDVATVVLHVKDDTIARFLSSLRMERDLVAVTSNARLARQLALLWGIIPVQLPKGKSPTRAVILNLLRKKKLLPKKSRIFYFDENRAREKTVDPFEIL
ncbi:MAG TPA: pyruvate kinase, partial [Patescibacteria group bacterium]|nr:pyruvate kinase [Patescibacteria group bacterium]